MRWLLLLQRGDHGVGGLLGCSAQCVVVQQMRRGEVHERRFLLGVVSRVRPRQVRPCGWHANLPAVRAGVLWLSVQRDGLDVFWPLQHGLLWQRGWAHGRNVQRALRVRYVRRSDSLNRLHVHRAVQRGTLRSRDDGAHCVDVRRAL